MPDRPDMDAVMARLEQDVRLCERNPGLDGVATCEAADLRALLAALKEREEMMGAEPTCPTEHCYVDRDALNAAMEGLAPYRTAMAGWVFEADRAEAHPLRKTIEFRALTLRRLIVVAMAALDHADYTKRASNDRR